MEFEKLSAPTLKDMFIQQLQGKILSGEIPEGTRLPSEREMAQQMQVSRAVINGGLTDLAEQGFLEISPRKGTVVANYRKNGNISALVAIMKYQGGKLGKDEIRSILELRRALEHLAVAHAIKHASDEEIETLRQILSDIEEAENISDASALAFEFQHHLSFIGNNSIIPLIYFSFKDPVITLWERFCGLYGIEALHHNMKFLYIHVRNRDKTAADNWIDTYLEEAISGSQQIYY